MQEMLDFVGEQIKLGKFVGLNTSDEHNGVTVYTVDYWQSKTVTDEIEGDIEIKEGKQKKYTF